MIVANLLINRSPEAGGIRLYFIERRIISETAIPETHALITSNLVLSLNCSYIVHVLLFLVFRLKRRIHYVALHIIIFLYLLIHSFIH